MPYKRNVTQRHSIARRYIANVTYHNSIVGHDKRIVTRHNANVRRYKRIVIDRNSNVRRYKRIVCPHAPIATIGLPYKIESYTAARSPISAVEGKRQ